MQSSMTNYAYYNDIDAFCCKVLRKNIALGHLPGGYIDERDIREVSATDFMGYQHIHLFAGIGGFPLGLEWAKYPNSIRTITGGFPCTDISNAGKRAGITGKQSGLWKEMYRLIQEAIDLHMGPDIIILENVSALINRGLSTVLGDLAEIGFDARWFCLRASDFGAPHQRERIFIVAYTSSSRQQEYVSSTIARSQGYTAWRSPSPGMEDTTSSRCQEWANPKGTYNQFNTSSTRQAKSRICRVPDGFSDRMDRPYRWPARPGEQQYEWEPSRVVTERQPDRAKRLKALGNAIVPQCVEYVARCVIDMVGNDYRKEL